MRRILFVAATAATLSFCIVLGRQTAPMLPALNQMGALEEVETFPVIAPARRSEEMHDSHATEALTAEIMMPDSHESGAIHIGEAMNPGDLPAASRSGRSSSINIGEPVNPRDISSWPQADGNDAIVIGKSMNPGAPATSRPLDNTDSINIGIPMNPRDLSAWPQSDGTEGLNFGEAMNPGTTVTGPN